MDCSAPFKSGRLRKAAERSSSSVSRRLGVVEFLRYVEFVYWGTVAKQRLEIDLRRAQIYLRGRQIGHELNSLQL